MEAIDDIIAYLRNAEVARCFAAIDDVNTMHHLLSVTADRIADARDGNAAAIREALEKIRHEWGRGLINARTCLSTDSDVDSVSRLFEEEIDAALAAPARNCDRFATADEAEREYCREAFFNGYEDPVIRAAFRWAFATAEGKAD